MQKVNAMPVCVCRWLGRWEGEGCTRSHRRSNTLGVSGVGEAGIVKQMTQRHEAAGALSHMLPVIELERREFFKHAVCLG